MPRADRTRNTSKRAALTPESRWPPTPSLPGSRKPKPPPLPDWLLEPAKPEGKSLGELCLQFRSEFSAYCDWMQEPPYEPDEDIMGRSISRREELRAAIIATPAQDIEGLKAKAEVMLAYAEVFRPGDDLDRDLATSIARDLVLAA
jgi:hypothetical protein